VAQEAEAAVPQGMRSGLSAADWAVVALYAVSMLVIGFYYSRRIKNTEDYYLGGRQMHSFMVGLSLFATLLSTISYLAVPGEMIQHGPTYLTEVLAVPITFVIVGFVLIPRLSSLSITSAYEILEKRLGWSVRIFGSVVFVMIRLVWMGLVVFLSGQIVVRAIGLEPENVKYAVIALGAITVIYSSVGGLRAVVLTDVVQTFIMFFGAITAIVLISVKLGGFSWFPTEWAPNWDRQPLFSFTPRTRISVSWTITHSVMWWLCTAGSDQMAVQRYLATRNAKAARRAFFVNQITGASTTILLALLGFALLGFFRANPQFLNEQLNLQSDADYLFPFFVIHFLGYGMAGLVISGMLAAAMSSLSSGVNSICTVINKDFMPNIMGGVLSEERRIRLAKWTAMLVGVVVIALGLIEGAVPGNIIEVTQKTNGLFVAPLFGLFYFALFSPIATPMGAVFGSLYGFLAAFLVAFWDLTGEPALSFQWIITTSLVTDILTGTLISLVPTRGKPLGARIAWGITFATPLAIIVALFIAKCVG